MQCLLELKVRFEDIGYSLTGDIEPQMGTSEPKMTSE